MGHKNKHVIIQMCNSLKGVISFFYYLCSDNMTGSPEVCAQFERTQKNHPRNKVLRTFKVSTFLGQRSLNVQLYRQTEKEVWHFVSRGSCWTITSFLSNMVGQKWCETLTSLYCLKLYLPVGKKLCRFQGHDLQFVVTTVMLLTQMLWKKKQVTVITHTKTPAATPNWNQCVIKAESLVSVVVTRKLRLNRLSWAVRS